MKVAVVAALVFQLVLCTALSVNAPTFGTRVVFAALAATIGTILFLIATRPDA